MIPPKLSGSHPLVGWLNKLRESVQEGTVTSFVNGKFSRGPGGTSLVGNKGGASSTAVAESGVWAEIQSIGQDYYAVKEWDWGSLTVSGVTFYAAKSIDLRGSIDVKVVDGITYTYSYGADTTFTTRSATDGTYSEDQDITPPFPDSGIDKVILVLPIDSTGVTVASVQLTWQDINIDGRAWTRKFNQS